MKRKIIFLVAAVLLLLRAEAQQYSALSWKHLPAAGQKARLLYDAKNAEWPAEEGFSAKLYFYDNGQFISEKTVSFKKGRAGWNSDFVIPGNSLFMSVVVQSADGQKRDNNHQRGYLFPMHHEGKVRSLAYAAMADLVGGGPADVAGLKKDQSLALSYMKEELRLYPEEEALFRERYYNMLANSAEKADKTELVNRLRTMRSEKESDLMMAQLYLSFFGGQKEADSLDRLLSSKFPEGRYVMEKQRRLRQQQASADVEMANDKSVPIGPGRSKAEIQKDLRENEISEALIPLSLKDLDGNTVDLSPEALQGKVLVLDFWATWCKPCVASFPAMQKVMEQYQGNPDVKFYFVATMERGDALKNVKEFLSKHPYPFQILMDEKLDDVHLFKAYREYKLTGGIPYKMVIDRKGKIRFRSSGFSGNEEELKEELSTMIGLALQ